MKVQRPRCDRKDDFYNWNMREARINCRISLRELGKLTGIPIPSIAAYERMKMYPDNEDAEKIASALGKSAEEIFPLEFRKIFVETREMRREGYGAKTESIFLSEVETSRLTVETKFPSEEFDFHELSTRLGRAMETLPYREREILKLRYGLGDAERCTLEEIGYVFGLTREGVRKIELRAIRLLKKSSRSSHLVGLLD